MTVERYIWIIVEPSNGHYNSQYAYDIIEELARECGVHVGYTHNTRDWGFGIEEEIVVWGSEDDVDAFEQALDSGLC